MLAERLSTLTTRYGSDPAAWQHEIHALAALETSDPKEALARFHALKRRLADFRRAALLRELRAFPFALDVPSEDTRGYAMKEVEADIRAATRALAHARAIADAAREEDDARRGLRHRALAPAPPFPAARWDALGPAAQEAEARRRVAAREARLDRRFDDARRRAGKAGGRVEVPDPGLPADALDAALELCEARLSALDALADAYRDATDPLKSPEVATYRGASRRALDLEARALRDAEDVAGLRALALRAQALRAEAAALASNAVRARRAGAAPPPRERRASDTMDGYG